MRCIETNKKIFLPCNLYLINSNMRCIETPLPEPLKKIARRLIVTWDVLKLAIFLLVGSRFRLIVTWDVLKPTTKQQKLILPAWLIVTWDVLKLIENTMIFVACVLINSNMRCIETCQVLPVLFSYNGLIVTWDVLKQYHIPQGEGCNKD